METSIEKFGPEFQTEFDKLSEKQHKMIQAKIFNAFTSKEDLVEFMKLHEDALGVIFTDASDKFIRIARMEKTPSCSVFEGSSYVKWFDHGSRDGGSIINLVEQNFEIGYQEAAFYVYKLLGGEEITNSDSQTAKQKYVAKPKVYAENIKPGFFEIKRIERKNNYDRYMHIMRGFTRTIANDDKKIIKIAKFLDIGYDEKYDRVFLPEIDEKGNYVGYYAYNREALPFKEGTDPIKGLIRKNQKPNLTGAHLLERWKPELPIILAEGHTDFVNLIANGYRAVTVGAATKTLKPFLPILKGRTIHIWYDDDLPGIKGSERIMKEILEYNDSVTLKDRIIFKPMFWSLAPDMEKSTKENRGKIFTQQMRKSLMTKFQLTKENIFWGYRKQKGYDFTDLLLETHDMEPALATKIKSYLSQYRKEEDQGSMF